MGMRAACLTWTGELLEWGLGLRQEIACDANIMIVERKSLLLVGIAIW